MLSPWFYHLLPLLHTVLASSTTLHLISFCSFLAYFLIYTHSQSLYSKYYPKKPTYLHRSLPAFSPTLKLYMYFEYLLDNSSFLSGDNDTTTRLTCGSRTRSWVCSFCCCYLQCLHHLSNILQHTLLHHCLYLLVYISCPECTVYITTQFTTLSSLSPLKKLCCCICHIILWRHLTMHVLSLTYSWISHCLLTLVNYSLTIVIHQWFYLKHTVLLIQM